MLNEFISCNCDVCAHRKLDKTFLTTKQDDEGVVKPKFFSECPILISIKDMVEKKESLTYFTELVPLLKNAESVGKFLVKDGDTVICSMFVNEDEVLNEEEVVNIKVGQKGLNFFSKEVYQNALDKGFLEDKTFGEIITHAHSELSEAFEEYRKGRGLSEIYHSHDEGTGEAKAEGVPVELIDVLNTILIILGEHNIDVESLLQQKLDFNKKRPYSVGGSKKKD